MLCNLLIGVLGLPNEFVAPMCSGVEQLIC